MADHFWLIQAQIERLKPYSRHSHGGDDLRVLGGIIYMIKRGLNSKLYAVCDGQGLEARSNRYGRYAHRFFSAICIAAIVI